jgi:peptidoglycan/LPS O-acetylase OafA/YrhL
MDFRKDLNGLRAIAVIAVVLFHYNATWLPGGFAGVDVFFVISGFLMTGIIFRGIEQKNFSILAFYVARGNRIIPALALLCLVLLVFGWFYLSPLDYAVLGEHVASSMGFISNMMYWREAGYFDAASHQKWLLHTWSLSAEWQFYILYPAVLVVMGKFMSLKRLKASVVLATIFGFILCIIATYKWPNAAYYLLPTRAWEMMMGGVAYLYPIGLKQRTKKLFEWCGLGLILGSYVLISKDNPWPGYLAIFPVLGSFLIIQARSHDSFITGNIVSQKIGAWSYSIYLWHWPIVVAIYYFSLPGIFVYLGIALSVLLGFLSHKYIEKINYKNHFSHYLAYLHCKPVVMALIVGLAGWTAFSADGFWNRFYHIDNIQELASNRKLTESYYREHLTKAFSNNGESYDESFLCTLDGGNQTPSTVVDCLTNKLGDSGYLLIGDSHGRDFLHSLRLAYPELNFAMLHRSACVPANYINIPRGGLRCFDILSEVKERFIIGNKKLRGIIFASLYADDLGLNSLISDIEHKVYGDVPMFIVNAGPRLKQSIVELAIKAAEVQDYYKLGVENQKAVTVNAKLAKIQGVNIFDKYSVFCQSERCMLNDNLDPYIWDGGHLSMLGIEKVSISLSATNFLNL